MNKLIRKISLLMCGTVYSVCSLNGVAAGNSAEIIPVREIVLEQQSIDNDSWFKELDSYEIKNENNSTIFDGKKIFSYSELEELDLVSETDTVSELASNYNCIYDWNTNRVTLGLEVEYNGSVASDELNGVVILNESGEEFDVVFCLDDGFALLSEMASVSGVDNIGFLSNAWNKLKKAVSSVLSHPSGVVGTVVTVLACAAVGVGVAMTGGALGVALLAGAGIGLVGAGATAMISTAWQNNGKIDWETVAIYAGLGACVGAIVSGGAYGITCCVSDVPAMKRTLKAADNNPLSTTTYIGKFTPTDGSSCYVDVAKANGGNYYSMDQATWNQLCNKYGQDFMTEVNKNFITGKFNVGNQFIATSNPATATGDFLKEINWINDMCTAYGKTPVWKAIGEFLWQLII